MGHLRGSRRYTRIAVPRRHLTNYRVQASTVPRYFASWPAYRGACPGSRRPRPVRSPRRPGQEHWRPGAQIIAALAEQYPVALRFALHTADRPCPVPPHDAGRAEFSRAS